MFFGSPSQNVSPQRGAQSKRNLHAASPRNADFSDFVKAPPEKGPHYLSTTNARKHYQKSLLQQQHHQQGSGNSAYAPPVRRSPGRKRRGRESKSMFAIDGNFGSVFGQGGAEQRDNRSTYLTHHANSAWIGGDETLFEEFEDAQDDWIKV